MMKVFIIFTTVSFPDLSVRYLCLKHLYVCLQLSARLFVTLKHPHISLNSLSLSRSLCVSFPLSLHLPPMLREQGDKGGNLRGLIWLFL